ncbi:hypothetical protein CBR_g50031 [Chara braunii]|uniref:Blue (type 1) copper domain-containing protein n=1 Tax=Chara braunii TaxID=69332 RepID=A0A388M5V7_CHABU|nr:hypothetical protein CBR_g50031 [Chara braunii]|eukprot:GBG89941.1 hypothetical protein CBR_g50031 [Chara braunii]
MDVPKDGINLRGVMLPWRRNVTYSTTIHAGEAVTWYWDDDQPHSIQATNEQFAEDIRMAIGSGDLAVSRTWGCDIQNANFSALEGPPNPCTLTPGSFLYSHNFTRPGRYTYRCSEFPNEMQGTVVVIDR